MVLFYTLGSVIMVSLISLLGALFYLINRAAFNRIIFASLALSSGVLLGSSLLDLYPESLKNLPALTPYLALAGILFFFVLEKIIHWHHCAEGENCPEKTLAYVSLLGDGLHNFVDGAAIAAAYLLNLPLGLSTTLAVIAHEIPHELSDFSLLIYSGFSPKKAVVYNLLSATTAILGALLVLFLSPYLSNLTVYLIPLTAGNFIYIAAADLFPELRHKRGLDATLAQALLIVLGIAIIITLKNYVGG